VSVFKLDGVQQHQRSAPPATRPAIALSNSKPPHSIAAPRAKAATTAPQALSGAPKPLPKPAAKPAAQQAAQPSAPAKSANDDWETF
jgi:hypothetical protein